MHMKDRCEWCWEEQYFVTRPGTNSSVEGNLFSPPTECSPETPPFPYIWPGWQDLLSYKVPK